MDVESFITTSQENNVRGTLKIEPLKFALAWKMFEPHLVSYYPKQRNYERCSNIKVLIKMSKNGKKEV